MRMGELVNKELSHVLKEEGLTCGGFRGVVR